MPAMSLNGDEIGTHHLQFAVVQLSTRRILYVCALGQRLGKYWLIQGQMERKENP